MLTGRLHAGIRAGSVLDGWLVCGLVVVDRLGGFDSRGLLTLFGFSRFCGVVRRLHGPLLEFSQSWVPGHRVQGQSWVPGRSLVVVVVD